MYVADAALCRKKNASLVPEAVKYVKAGGTLAFMGACSSCVPPFELPKLFKAFDLAWRTGDYCRCEFAVNPEMQYIDTTGMPNPYFQKALHLKGVEPGDAVYRAPPDMAPDASHFGAGPADKFEVPTAIARVGVGRLAWIGDVNGEEGSNETLLRLCAPAPKPLAEDAIPVKKEAVTITATFAEAQATDMTNTKIVILAPDQADDCKELHKGLIAAMTDGAEVILATTVPDAESLITAKPDPQAIIATDASLCNDSGASLPNKVIKYVHAGGILVFAGHFPSVARFTEIEKLFLRFRLPWRSGDYTSATLNFNPFNDTIDTNGLKVRFTTKALYLDNVAKRHAVYLDFGHSKSHGKRVQSPVVYAKVGRGRIGFVGDVNGSAASVKAITSMCNLGA